MLKPQFRPIQVAVLSVVVAAAPTVFAQVRDITPLGGDISELATSTIHQGVVLCCHTYHHGHPQRVLRSSDDGRTFEYVSGAPTVPLGQILSVDFGAAGDAYALISVISPVSGLVSSLVWHSGDAGQTWSSVTLPFSSAADRARDLAASPVAPGHLWVTVDLGLGQLSVLRSADHGQNWTSFAVPSPAGESAMQLALHPSRALEAVIATERYVFSTVDGGATWVQNPSPLASESLDHITYVGDRVLAGPRYGQLFASDDKGATWFPTSLSTGIEAIRSDITAQGRVTVSTQRDGLYESIDGGTTWSPRAGGPGKLDVTSIAFDAAGEPLLGSAALGALRWDGTRGNFLLATDGLVMLSVLQFALDESDHSHLVALPRTLSPISYGEFGLESWDDGATWTPMSLPDGAELNQMMLDQGGVLHVAGLAVSAGSPDIPSVWKRTSTGWQDVGPGITLSQPASHVRLSLSASDPEMMVMTYTATVGLNSCPYAVFTFDGGTTWQPVVEVVTSGDVEQVEILEGTTAPRVLFLIWWDVLGNGFISSGLAYTDDHGATFAGGHGGNGWLRMAQSRQSSRRVASINSFIAPLGVSEDGATSWAPHGPGVRGLALAVGSVNRDLVAFATTSSAHDTEIFVSTDAGLSWDLALGGLPGNQPCGLAFESDDSELYIWSFTIGARAIAIEPRIGASICGPAVANASDRDARIVALGTTSIQANDARLHAERLPADTFGYFLASRSAGFVTSPGGSFGNLCVSGAIGRYAKTVQLSGPLGVLDMNLDLQQLAQPTGPIAAVTGESWTFQAWFRDAQGATTGSNFTDAVTVAWTL